MRRKPHQVEYLRDSLTGRQHFDGLVESEVSHQFRKPQVELGFEFSLQLSFADPEFAAHGFGVEFWVGIKRRQLMVNFFDEHLFDFI